MTAFFIASFLLFNFIFSPYAKTINISNETKIQKDAFSAVLFVSETIGKISRSITDMFALKSSFAESSSEKKSEKSETATDMNIVFLSQLKNKKTDNTGASVFKIHLKGIFDSTFAYEPHLRKRVDGGIVSNFLERLLLYISSKNTYDNIAALNNINSLFANPS